MLLSIDTSSRYGGVALSDADGSVADGSVIEARLWRSTANHTAQLMPAVAEILTARGIRARDLDAVAVALGPGPFSALRVGVSAAKGLAMAADFPIIGIDTLLMEAWPHVDLSVRPHWPGGAIPIAWLDAGRNEVAAGVFGNDAERVRDDRIASPEELLSQDAGNPWAALYCGEAAWARRDVIKTLVGDGHGYAVMPWTPADRLWALAELAAIRIRDGESDDLATLQPYYLRMPTIGVARQRDRVRQGRPGDRSQRNQQETIA